MNRFIWARIVGMVPFPVFCWSLQFLNWKNPFPFPLPAIIFGCVWLVAIVFWITDLCRLIDQKIENKELKFSLLVAMIEIIKDLFAGRNNQMATFNKRKRREKLGSFE